MDKQRMRVDTITHHPNNYGILAIIALALVAAGIYMALAFGNSSTPQCARTFKEAHALGLTCVDAGEYGTYSEVK